MDTRLRSVPPLRPPSPPRRGERVLARPPIFPTAPLPCTARPSDVPVGLRGGTDALASPPVSGRSGGSRSSFQRESSAPSLGLDAERLVQADGFATSLLQEEEQERLPTRGDFMKVPDSKEWRPPDPSEEKDEAVDQKDWPVDTVSYFVSSGDEISPVPVQRMERRLGHKEDFFGSKFVAWKDAQISKLINKTNLMKLRPDYNDEFVKKHGVKLSPISCFIKEYILETQDRAEVERIQKNIELCKKKLPGLGYNEFTYEDFFAEPCQKMIFPGPAQVNPELRTKLVRIFLELARIIQDDWMSTRSLVG